MIGKIFHNRYEILDVLGTGGTSIVYKGKDILLNRLVTIKILREQYANDADFVRRFRNEAQAVACLSHPNIVRIYDVVFEGDSHYLVMEYIEGCSLKEYIDDHGMLPFEQALKVTVQLLSALAHAHDHNVIHRDIKPHNILLDANLNVKVTDFGIAVAVTDMTQTYTKDVMGSVHYMSPEQVKGTFASEASDIYSVGVVLYELLTGVQPFSGENAIGVAMQHIQGELQPPHKINPKISLGVSAVIMKAMRKDPELRYGSALEMLDALKSAKLTNSAADLSKIQSGQLGAEFAVDTDSTFNNRQTPRVNNNLNTNLNTNLMEETKITDDDRYSNGQKRQQNRQPAPTASASKSGNKFFVNKKPTKAGWIAIVVAAAALIAVVSLVSIFGNVMQGGKDVVVPMVEGISLEEAQAAMDEMKLTYSVTQTFDEEVEAGYVISQDIPAGQTVKEGRIIQLIVSDGQEQVVVPYLEGMTLREATLALSNLKLIITGTEVSDDTVPAGQVISQTPKANEQVPIRTTVDVVISKGKQVKVPKLVGLTADQAKAKLAESKLILGTTSKKGSTEQVADIVLSQGTQVNTMVAEGSAVDLVISTGPGPTASKARVTYTLPETGEEHTIRIVVTDTKGSHEEYSGRHFGGETVVKDISFYTKGTVQVLMDGNEVYSQEVAANQ